MHFLEALGFSKYGLSVPVSPIRGSLVVSQKLLMREKAADVGTLSIFSCSLINSSNLEIFSYLSAEAVCKDIVVSSGYVDTKRHL